MSKRRLVGTTLAVFVLLCGPALAHEAGDQATTHPAPKQTEVSVAVEPDEVKGYNLFLATKAFRWAPKNVNQEHRKGEGHAHLYVDDVKITRLYGPAYYLGELPAGTHVVRVTLNGNDHGDYVIGDDAVESEVQVTVAGTSTTTMPAG